MDQASRLRSVCLMHRRKVVAPTCKGVWYTSARCDALWAPGTRYGNTHSLMDGQMLLL